MVLLLNIECDDSYVPSFVIHIYHDDRQQYDTA